MRKIIKSIYFGAVQRLVVTHKDRLMRFGAELIFSLCESFGTEVAIINAKEDQLLKMILSRPGLSLSSLQGYTALGAVKTKSSWMH